MASKKRLIDVDARIEEIKKAHCTICESYGGIRCRACWVDDVIGMIDDSPTVDAVEVVRCKDCKWFKKGTPFRHECNNICAGMFYVRQEDFCSYGERKDNGTKAD